MCKTDSLAPYTAKHSDIINEVSLQMLVNCTHWRKIFARGHIRKDNVTRDSRLVQLLIIRIEMQWIRTGNALRMDQILFLLFENFSFHFFFSLFFFIFFFTSNFIYFWFLLKFLGILFIFLSVFCNIVTCSVVFLCCFFLYSGFGENVSIRF